MADNATFPFGVVDVEAVNDPISFRDVIPLKDGRSATIVDITFSGVSTGEIYRNLSEYINITIEFPDFTDPAKTLRLTMPYNMLVEGYIRGDISVLNAMAKPEEVV